MKKIMTIVSTVLLLSACASDYQSRSTATGAAVGATAGAVIGSQTDQPMEGAIIGGVLGAMAGAVLADNSNDRVIESEPRYHRRSACQEGADYFDRAASIRDLDRKISLMREGLRLCPSNPAAHNDLGVALMLRGNNAEAERHFGHALDLDRDYAPAQRNLARLQRDSRNERNYDRQRRQYDDRYHDDNRDYYRQYRRDRHDD